VNRNELEDILSYDRYEALLTGVGLFLLSGALWLGIDKLSAKWEFNVVVAICGCCVVFGLVLLALGARERSRKRGKIQRIFDETRIIGTQVESPSP